MKRIGALLLAAALVGGCSDDNGNGNGTPDKGVADKSTGEGSKPAVTILPFDPATVTLAENQLHDVKVMLSEPAPQAMQVDVVSKDTVSVTVVHPTVTFKKWDQEAMTTIQALKVTTQDVGVEFSVTNSTATATLMVKVVKELPDAGPPSDS